MRKPIDSPMNLIHRNESKYFVVAILISVMTYISLFVSLIGIIYVGLVIAVSIFLHALMIGHIRTNGVRLNPEQFAKVYDKVTELCAKMEMNHVPDVYVLESSGALNAFATRFFGRNMVVLYSTVFELIEEGAEDELTFIIAHELAHIKRRHITKQLLVLPAMWIPGVTQAYSRSCEYTCDRIAAYNTEHSEAAKNCLTMLGAGKILYKRVNRESYLNQINEEKGFVIWLSEVLSTHPPLPKRIREIELFMGDEVQMPMKKRLSKKLWIGIYAATLLLIGAIGGGIYALNQLVIPALTELENSGIMDPPSPLTEAVIAGDKEEVNRLLQTADYNLDVQDLEGWTALHWAVQASDIETAKMLLHAGADPNIEDYSGVVPIMTAASNGNVDMIRLLLGATINIDHQNYDGWTPIMYAVSSGHIEIVRALLEAGANAGIKDYADSSALKLAIQQGNQEITSLLRSHDK